MNTEINKRFIAKVNMNYIMNTKINENMNANIKIDGKYIAKMLKN